MLARLQSAAADLRIVCLHGKLPADEIDDRMMSFVEGEADVLLATNIVESGLDIPRLSSRTQVTVRGNAVPQLRLPERPGLALSQKCPLRILRNADRR